MQRSPGELHMGPGTWNTIFFTARLLEAKDKLFKRPNCHGSVAKTEKDLADCAQPAAAFLASSLWAQEQRKIICKIHF